MSEFRDDLPNFLKEKKIGNPKPISALPSLEKAPAMPDVKSASIEAALEAALLADDDIFADIADHVSAPVLHVEPEAAEPEEAETIEAAVEALAIPVAVVKQAEPAPVNVPVFLNGATREKAVSLEYPLAFAGKEYHVVVLKRMNRLDAENYKANGATGMLPIYFHQDGSKLPLEVFEALDYDDHALIAESANAFLPKRI
jgi:hypothetical protein